MGVELSDRVLTGHRLLHRLSATLLVPCGRSRAWILPKRRPWEGSVRLAVRPHAIRKAPGFLYKASRITIRRLARIVNLNRAGTARSGLPLCKRLAAHHGVDGIEDGQALDIRYSANGIGSPRYRPCSPRCECRPQGKARSVRIARPGEVDPIAGHLVGQASIARGPFPRRLVQVVEDIPSSAKWLAPQPAYTEPAGNGGCC